MITPAELGRYTAGGGELTMEGREAIRDMLLAAAVRDPAVLIDAGPVAQKIEHAVGNIATLRGTDWDPSILVTEVFRAIGSARAKGLTIRDLAGQGDLLAGTASDIPPLVFQMAEFLEASNKAAISRAFRSYTVAAKETLAAGGSAGDMFGGTGLIPETAFRKAFGLEAPFKKGGGIANELGRIRTRTAVALFGAGAGGAVGAKADPKHPVRGAVLGAAGGAVLGGGAFSKALRNRRGQIGAYHGSPHKFDKFSMDKVGTGEGAQAYGHGLYFTDKKEIADHYRKSLAGLEQHVFDPADLAGRGFRPGEVDLARTTLAKHGGRVDMALSDLGAMSSGGMDEARMAGNLIRGQQSKWKKVRPGSTYKVDLDVDDVDLLDWDKPLSEQSPKVQAALAASPVVQEITAARRFGYSLADFRALPADRQAALRAYKHAKVDSDQSGSLLGTESGANTYRSISEELSKAPKDEGWTSVAQTINDRGANDAAASKALREAGIKGIRYRDGSSRSPKGAMSWRKDLPEGWTYYKRPDGVGIKDAKGLIVASGYADEAQAHKSVFGVEPSYNYVIFDDAAVSIAERGAVSPGALGAVGGTAAGAAVGATQGGTPRERVENALTYGIMAGIGSSLLLRAATKGRRVQAAKNAHPDVLDVLTEPFTKPKPMLGAAGAIVASGRRVYQQLVDDVYALRKLGRDVGKSAELSEEVSRARGWRGWGDELVEIRESSVAASHPTLRRAVNAAAGQEADVTALLRAERAIELEDAGKGWYLKADRATAERVVYRLGADPAVRGAADEMRSFYAYLLELRWKNGLIDDDAYQAIRASGQMYVPFIPAASDAERIFGGAKGGKLFNRTTGVRKLHGTPDALESGYAKVDPWAQAVEDAYATARDVSRQRVFQTVASIVEQSPNSAAPYIRNLGTTLPQGHRTDKVVAAIVNGKRNYFEVADPDLYDALGAVGPSSQAIVTKILSYPAQWLRTGVTIVPEFGIANATRDAFFTSTQFKAPVGMAAGGAVAGAGIGAWKDEKDRWRGALRGAGFGAGAGVMAPHAARILRGVKHIYSNDELYQAWLREGAAGTGFFARNNQDVNRMLKSMRGHDSPLRVLNPRSWWDALIAVNRAVEEGPRVAKFAADLKTGKTPRGAAVGSREVSLDFSRGGGDPMVKFIRPTSAFWNPHIQGIDKIRTILNPVKNPKGYAIGLTAMTAPTIALWTINKDDPSYWERQVWERNLFWLVPVGKDENGHTDFLRIPKPFEVGFLFASLPERLLDYTYQRDPERLMHALKDMGRQVGEGLAPLPTAIEPPFEAATGDRGYDRFLGRAIVSPDVADLPKREQYNIETGYPAIAASRAIEKVTGAGVSPQKVEHFGRGYFGTAGEKAMRWGDQIAKTTGLDERGEPIGRNAPKRGGLTGRFFTRESGFSTDDGQTMWRRWDEAERHMERLRDLKSAGNRDEWEAYKKEHEEAITWHRQLKDEVQEIRRLNRIRRKVEQHQTMTADDKREAIRKLGERVRALSGSAISGTTPEVRRLEAELARAKGAIQRQLVQRKLDHARLTARQSARDNFGSTALEAP